MNQRDLTNFGNLMCKLTSAEIFIHSTNTTQLFSISNITLQSVLVNNPKDYLTQNALVMLLYFVRRISNSKSAKRQVQLSLNAFLVTSSELSLTEANCCDRSLDVDYAEPWKPNNDSVDNGF